MRVKIKLEVETYKRKDCFGICFIFESFKNAKRSL